MRFQGETKVIFRLWRMYGSVAATFKNCPRQLTNATESDVQIGSLVLRQPRVVVAGVTLLSSNSLRRLSLLIVRALCQNSKFLSPVSVVLFNVNGIGESLTRGIMFFVSFFIFFHFFIFFFSLLLFKKKLFLQSF